MNVQVKEVQLPHSWPFSCLSDIQMSSHFLLSNKAALGGAKMVAMSY